MRRAKQQELQAGPSQLQIITRVKGKETMLSEAEAGIIQQAERGRASLQGAAKEATNTTTAVEKMQAPPPPPPKETATTNLRQHVPPRVRPTIIPIEENFDRSKSDDEENYQRGYQRRRQHHDLRTPLSEELEEYHGLIDSTRLCCPSSTVNQTPKSSCSNTKPP